MKRITCLALVSILAGCGGSSDNSSNSPSSKAAPVAAGSGYTQPTLDGTWAVSTGSHLVGNACGLNASGQPEVRETITFTGTSYSGTQDNCVIIAGGNTGGFVSTKSGGGTIVIGAEYFDDGAMKYNALDMHFTEGTANTPTVEYTGYNITGNQLRIAVTAGSMDGSSAAARADGTNYPTGPFIKQ